MELLPIDFRGKGRFQPGPDSRRHRFTREECRKGFQAAEASLARRFPGADVHFLMCALIGCKPAHTFYPTPTEFATMTEADIIARYAR